MTVSEAVKQRKSTRAFLPKPVEQAKFDRIFDAARHTPSGVNMQPWDIAIVSGATKQALENAILKAFDAGEPTKMEYCYYPKTWFEPYKSRRKATGLQMYGALGIAREDKARQVAQWRANYRAFDAPSVIFFFLHSELETGSFLDYGMFMQSVMLLAEQEGLATCSQAALAEYPDIVREVLGISEEKMLIAAMAIGYEDKAALINSYRTPRIEKEAFTTYFS